MSKPSWFLGSCKNFKEWEQRMQQLQMNSVANELAPTTLAIIEQLRYLSGCVKRGRGSDIDADHPARNVFEYIKELEMLLKEVRNDLANYHQSDDDRISVAMGKIDDYLVSGQSASAARIAELETEVEHATTRTDMARKGLDEQLAKRLVLEKENEALKSALLKCGEAYADKDLKVAELESDAKIMAEELTTAHCVYFLPNRGKQLRHCTCYACIIAAKYK